MIPWLPAPPTTLQLPLAFQISCHPPLLSPHCLPFLPRRQQVQVAEQQHTAPMDTPQQVPMTSLQQQQGPLLSRRLPDPMWQAAPLGTLSKTILGRPSKSELQQRSLSQANVECRFRAWPRPVQERVAAEERHHHQYHQCQGHSIPCRPGHLQPLPKVTFDFGSTPMTTYSFCSIFRWKKKNILEKMIRLKKQNYAFAVVDPVNEEELFEQALW